MRSAVPLDAVLLGVAMFMVSAAANILTPLLPLVQRDFAVDYVTAGVLVSAFGLARLALDLPAGFLEARLGGPRLAGAGYALLLAGSLLTALAPTFELAVVGRVGMGLGCAVVSVVVLTTLSSIAPANARTRVLTCYSVSNNTAIGIFPVVGGVVGVLFGWRSTMLLCGLLALISASLLGWVLPRARAASRARAPTAPQRENRLAISRLGLLALGAVYFGVMINMINRHGFRNTTLPLFAADQLGLNAVQIASGVSLMAVVGLLVAIPAGMLADRWSRRGVICAGFLVLAIGDISFLGVSSYATFLLAAFVLGLGDFFSASQTAALTESVPRAWRSRVLGGYRFSVDLGAAVGPVLLATLLQHTGYQTMLFAMIGLLLAAAASGWTGALAARSSRAPDPERPATSETVASE
ncbi:MAG TPA: MFS transporter [Chloroflexota bacterium]|nr:MFS transporter [Chloroflexota bacterium]